MVKKLKKLKLKKEKVKKLPENPGVYFFWENGKPLYIGKAINLRKRVNSYLTSNLARKTKKMIEEANELSYIEVTSELESLLLEARLVRENKPKYNVELKDDKHPLYIKITKEKYPRVLTARRKEEEDKNIAFFGPFPSSRNVRSVLKTLRKVFPYATHKPGKKPCLYSQMGLCDPCPSAIENKKVKEKKKKLQVKYKENIKQIKGVLSGEIKSVRKNLEKQMNKLSEEKDYEEAAQIRDRIERLDYITQPIIPVERFVENPNLAVDIREEEMEQLGDIISKHNGLKEKPVRIECYDIAHLSGVHPTASMVTFVNGEPDKSYYRHFKIRQEKGADDVSSMKEVAKRRLKHLADWGTPDLIVVDGGKAQVAAFKNAFKEKGIPVVGIAKRTESLVIPVEEKEKNFEKINLPKGPALNLLQRLRDEAHRFARKYHHKLLKKSLLPE